jgi:membrane protease YdiL (CAAX protease family)
MEAKQIAVRTLAVSIVGVLSLEFFLRWALSSHPLMLLGMIRLFQAILVALAAKAWNRGLPSLGIDSSTLFSGFKRGLLWSAGFALLCCVLFSVLLLFDLNLLKLLQARLPRKSTDLFLFFLVGGVIAPVTEEIFFRGLVYGFLRRWGFPAALVLSTLFFVLVHPMDRSLPVTQIVGGLIFAVAYELEGNLVVPITIHALGNLAIFSACLILR